MIIHIEGNVLDVNAEILVNAANGVGWMGGFIGRFIPLKGVAETIHFNDPSIERFAKKEAKVKKPKCGDIFVTSAGKLDFPKGIIHAVTMHRPGQTSNLHTIKTCIKKILVYCEENNIKSVSLPILGTGTGRLLKKDVLKMYSEMLESTRVLFYIVHYKKK